MAVETQELTGLLLQHRQSLVGFLVALTGNRDEADDLFQQTSLELWRLRDKFEPGSNFGAWARHLAKIQALRHWRTSRRNQPVPITPDVLDQLAEDWDETPESTPRATALRGCLSQLEDEQKTILRRRYSDGASVASVASETGRNEGGLKMLLMRLRRKLAECVGRKLKQE